MSAKFCSGFSENGDQLLYDQTQPLGKTIKNEAPCLMLHWEMARANLYFVWMAIRGLEFASTNITAITVLQRAAVNRNSNEPSGSVIHNKSPLNNCNCVE